MERQNNESDKAFNDRQWQENQTHDQNSHKIDADIIAMFVNK